MRKKFGQFGFNEDWDLIVMALIQNGNLCETS